MCIYVLYVQLFKSKIVASKLSRVVGNMANFDIIVSNITVTAQILVKMISKLSANY